MSLISRLQNSRQDCIRGTNARLRLEFISTDTTRPLKLSPSRREAPCEGINSAGRFFTPGYFEKHSGIQSCPYSMSWTLDVQWSWLLCACARFERVKTGNQQPPDWLRQKVCISIRNVSNLTVILQTIF